jgi:hypothetical protein
MPLSFIVTDLAAVPEPVREHYTKAADGTYTLRVEGHPDATKVAEFRERNVELLKTVAKFDGIDPATVKSDRAKLTSMEAQLATTPLRVAELETQLAAVQQKADRSVLRDALRGRALSAGAIPAAIDILLDKAEPVFEVKNDAVHARPNTFSASRPGELITPEEWIVGATVEFPFLFATSSGGGADPKRGGGGTTSATTLRNPTPQQLGQHARAITEGTMRVEFTT